MKKFSDRLQRKLRKRREKNDIYTSREELEGTN